MGFISRKKKVQIKGSPGHVDCKYLYLASEKGPNLDLCLIQTHKSFSGKIIIAYDLLPKLADIQNKQLNSVVIDDY